MIIYVLILILASRPFITYGRTAYLGLKERDYSKFKANFLFFGITLVAIGMVTFATFN